MEQLASRVRPGLQRIEPYVPGLTDDELMRRFGLERVIKLNANENALGPSPLALQAIQAELPRLHHYPDGGSEELREAIAAFHHVGTDQVFVGNGSDDIIKLISETFLNPADEIVVPVPSFSQYAFGAAVMQAQVRGVPLGPEFAYDIEALATAVNQRTKLVYVCSPNNPTGTILRQEDAERLLHQLPENVIVVFDFAYNDFTECPDRVVESEALLCDPRVVVLHTFSKLYGLAGLRVGYALGDPELWSFVHRVREPFNVNRMAQRAAAAALADEAHRRASIRHVAMSRNLFAAWARRHGLQAPPTEANFILLRTGDGVETMNRLMTHGVMVRAGFSGLPEWVRVTFGTEEENEACLRALEAVLHLA
ncbi:MAG: histidinol-phosphate transaminase [Alicyclobacillus sp.]|nr:histidinol-phosphate transaminase [Alicyclobacillus sp.]